MTQAEALLELKDRCAWDKTPALDEDQLNRILVNTRTPDANGLATDDADWGTPTGDPITTPDGLYDFNWAAQLAWERKSGLSASCINFTSDGEKWDRSQIKQHCDEMAATYRRKRAQTLGSYDLRGTSLDLLPWQIGNGPWC